MEAGKVDRSEMYRTFNMGVGMVVICAADDVTFVLSAAEKAGLEGWRIGSLRPGSGSVILN